MSKQINECIQYTSPDPGSECIYVGDNILPVPLWGPRRNRKQFTQPIAGSHCCIMKFLITNGLKPQHLPPQKKNIKPQPRANSSLRGRVKRGLKWQPATKGIFLSSVRNGRGWDKTDRNVGAYLWQWVAQAFQEGENTQIAEPEACSQVYKSLAWLHSNYCKHKYPHPRDTSFSGLSLEEYKLILSTDTLDEFKEMNKGMWKKLQKFVPRKPKEKHKA